MKKPEDIYMRLRKDSYEKLQEEIALLLADNFGKKARQVYYVTLGANPKALRQYLSEETHHFSPEQKMILQSINAAEGLYVRAKTKLIDAIIIDKTKEEKKNDK